MNDTRDVRTYLVVIDDTPEAEKALRFAARRAAKTHGAVEIVALVPRAEFVAWGGVQATLEDEAREHAQEVVARALDMLDEEERIAMPAMSVLAGDPVEAILSVLAGNPAIAALVLGASASGTPGPLVNHFAGQGTGNLPCPVMIIPGSLSAEAIDRLS